MPESLVETKLHVPTRRRAAVARPRLYQRLLRSTGARLTLVAAPAGFGKTTLLGTWLAADRSRRSAWVSLDERDADPAPVLGLRPRARWSGLSRGRLAVAGSDERGAAASSRAVCRPDQRVERGARDRTLGLDDYHRWRGWPSSRARRFCRLPPSPGPSGDQRAGRAGPSDCPAACPGQQVEVGAAELRFTYPEAAVFLTELGLTLSPEDVAALAPAPKAGPPPSNSRDCRSSNTPTRRVHRGFAGETGTSSITSVKRYSISTRPRATSARHLDPRRVTGPLCDSVGDAPTARRSWRPSSARICSSCHSMNPRWYRYHHLFAEVLRAHLVDERPETVAELHRRASAWYAAAGGTEAAVRHALAAGDELTGRRIWWSWRSPRPRRQRREAVIRGLGR